MSVVKLEVRLVSVDTDLYETDSIQHIKYKFINLEELLKMAAESKDVETLRTQFEDLVADLLKEL